MLVSTFTHIILTIKRFVRICWRLQTLFFILKTAFRIMKKGYFLSICFNIVSTFYE